MAFADKTLQCSDCGASFIFSAKEQEFFASKGYANEPKRCPSCRRARRTQNPGSGERLERQMFSAVCARCGQETEVPFKPREGRPVYCSGCYNMVKLDK